jgi:hypothetical protein
MVYDAQRAKVRYKTLRHATAFCIQSAGVADIGISFRFFIVSFYFRSPELMTPCKHCGTQPIEWADEFCQDCWEAYCDREWWKMVEALSTSVPQ